jgi:hypothetical protein
MLGQTLAILSSLAVANTAPFLQADAAAWLEAHPRYYALQDKDCRCDEELVYIRTQSRGQWKAQPAYHPFAMQGDFNGDGRADIALVLGDRQSKNARRVLILTARSTGSPTIYLSENIPGTAALFFGAPRPKPYRLLVGEFESDSGFTVIPQRNGRYTLRS